MTRPRCGIITAVSLDGVIGRDGSMPWDYPGDLKRFKGRTLGCTVIMGRRTFESLGSKPLPGRRNIVLTSANLDVPGVERFRDARSAAEAYADPVWFIGGEGVYRAALEIADFAEITLIPETMGHFGAVMFPKFGPDWHETDRFQHAFDSALEVVCYERRTTNDDSI